MGNKHSSLLSFVGFSQNKTFKTLCVFWIVCINVFICVYVHVYIYGCVCTYERHPLGAIHFVCLFVCWVVSLF